MADRPIFSLKYESNENWLEKRGGGGGRRIASSPSGLLFRVKCAGAGNGACFFDNDSLTTKNNQTAVTRCLLSMGTTSHPGVDPNQPTVESNRSLRFVGWKDERWTRKWTIRNSLLRFFPPRPSSSSSSSSIFDE